MLRCRLFPDQIFPYSDPGQRLGAIWDNGKRGSEKILALAESHMPAGIQMDEMDESQ